MVNLHSVNFRSCLIFYIFLQLQPNHSSSHASTSHLTLWQNCCSVWNCCRLTRSTLACGKTHASAMSVRSLSDNRREWVVTCETRSLRHHTKIIFVRQEVMLLYDKTAISHDFFSPQRKEPPQCQHITWTRHPSLLLFLNMGFSCARISRTYAARLECCCVVKYSLHISSARGASWV